MLQLNPPIPIYIVKNDRGFPSGTGLSHFITDYSIEYDVIWHVFMDDSTESWFVPNKFVRGQKNITALRGGGLSDD